MHSTYYPDSAIPAVGIISKLCLQITRFRRELSNESNVYFLLLRALLLFHKHPGVKVDCAVTLFLLVQNEYSIGSNDITIPQTFTTLKVPFTCNIRWKESPFCQTTALEDLLNHSHSKVETDCISESTLSDNFFATTIPHISLDAQFLWQYIRIYFAHLWFDGCGNILTKLKSNIMTPMIYECDSPALKFDSQLQLTASDLQTIKSTLPAHSIPFWLRTISNATSHGDVLFGFSQIENFILLSENSLIPFNDFKNVTMRFVSAVPNSHGDEIVFKYVLNILEKLMKRGKWLLIRVWFMKR